jgi:hypothetical protein
MIINKPFRILSIENIKFFEFIPFHFLYNILITYNHHKNRLQQIIFKKNVVIKNIVIVCVK